MLVHTGGAAWVDGIAMPAGEGPGIEVAGRPDVEPARVRAALSCAGLAERVGAVSTPRYQLHLLPRDSAFAGESVDLAVASAVLLAWFRVGLVQLAEEGDPDALACVAALRSSRPLAPDDPERPAWCPSGRVRAEGVIEPVVGWREKLAAAARFAPGRPLRIACAPEDVSEAAEAARAARVDATVVGAAHPLTLAGTLLAGLGLPGPLADRLRARLSLPEPWTPPGWPPVSAGLALVLAVARAVAEPDGYVGLEHLVSGLERVIEPSRLGDLGRSPAWAALRAPADYPWTVEPTRPRGGVTPRLGGLGDRLRAGADLDDLVRDLWTHPRSGFRPLEGQELIHAWTEASAPAVERVAGPPKDRTWRTALDLPAPGAVLRLLVTRGPEDGRVIVLASGQTLGRAADPVPDVGLYAGTPVVDDRLSRAHLRWTGTGVLPLGPVVVIRGHRERSLTVGEPHAVHLGDELRLTPRTRLRVLAS